VLALSCLETAALQRLIRLTLASACALALMAPAGLAETGDAVPAAPEPTPDTVLPDAVAGEVIVKARGPELRATLDQVDARHATELGEDLHLVAVAPGEEVTAAQQLAADPAVEYAEPNYVRVANEHQPAQMAWGTQWMRAPEVWTAPLDSRGQGVRVAVLDSGVDIGHPRLTGRVVGGFNAYRGSVKDDCGHGTAVAGVIAASDRWPTTAGVAPDAHIVPVKVLRHEPFFGVCAGNDAAIVKGIQWAVDRGRADIINMSLSGPHHSRALADAIAYAVSNGVLVVAAAGNSGDRTVTYPAAYPWVLSVGGVRRVGDELARWRHSSFGAVDVAAPAHNVPVIVARGVDADQVGRLCRDGHTRCADGTSFAAPHVAGLAALLHSRHPDLADAAPGARIRKVRQWILATARQVPGTRRGVNLHSGHGWPDAVRAVTAADRPAAPLVTWRTTARVVAPRRMAGGRPRLRLAVVVTDGTGTPLRDVPVTFQPVQGTRSSVRSGRTGRGGQLATIYRDTVGGRRTQLAATVAERTVRVETYALHRDDNTPGVRPQGLRFRGSLDGVYDWDDVFRFPLRAGETLRARATVLQRRRGYLDLYLHRPGTKDVTDPQRAPLKEDTPADRDDPLRMAHTARRDGRYYLNVYGTGTYRLAWSIVSPDAVRGASASPGSISRSSPPHATTVRWEVARRGKVSVRVRDAQGRVRRRVPLGSRGPGQHAYRWRGRDDRGAAVAPGRYRVIIRWTDGRGRVAQTVARVRVTR